MKNTVSNELVIIVNDYIKTKAAAEVLRIEVDKIKKEVLKDFPLYNDEGNQITEIKYDWLSADENESNHYYKIISDRCRKAGIKPDEMKDDFCPALVAENNVRKIEHILIDASSEELSGKVPGLEKITVNNLLCLGMEKYKEYIKLIVGLTMSSSNYKK